jgi:hypothetical protein
MHFSCRIRGTERNFSSYMRIGVMEDAQGSYINEEDIIGMNVGMGSVEMWSNGKKDRKYPITMRNLQRKVYHQSTHIDLPSSSTFFAP